MAESPVLAGLPANRRKEFLLTSPRITTRTCPPESLGKSLPQNLLPAKAEYPTQPSKDSLVVSHCTALVETSGLGDSEIQGAVLKPIICTVGATFRPLVQVGWADKPNGPAVFQMVFATLREDLIQLTRSAYRRANPHLRRYACLEDMVQEAALALRRFSQKKPLELFQTPDSARKILACIVRRVFSSHARRYSTAKRDVRRVDSRTLLTEDQYPSREKDTVLDQMAVAEMAERCMAHLSDREKRLVQLRLFNHSWEEIAEIMGGTADGNRMAYGRALDRMRRHSCMRLHS